MRQQFVGDVYISRCSLFGMLSTKISKSVVFETHDTLDRIAIGLNAMQLNQNENQEGDLIVDHNQRITATEVVG